MSEAATAQSFGDVFRSSRVSALRKLYSEAGIGVEGFACKHQQLCAADAAPRPLKHGAEAHIGSRYGEALRVVAVSMDVGGGNFTQTIQFRSESIESLGRSLNPQMKGTRQFLSALLRPDIGENPPFAFFAMTNAAKCSGSDDSMNKSPNSLYSRCKPYALEEIGALQPELVWLQGRTVGGVVGDRFKFDTTTMSGLGPEVDCLVREFVGRIWLNDQPTVCVETPHPSDRYGRWAQFERAFLPLIAQQARRQALKERDNG